MERQIHRRLHHAHHLFVRFSCADFGGRNWPRNGGGRKIACGPRARDSQQGKDHTNRHRADGIARIPAAAGSAWSTTDCNSADRIVRIPATSGSARPAAERDGTAANRDGTDRYDGEPAFNYVRVANHADRYSGTYVACGPPASP